ncbi:lysine-specific demethylase 2B-like protein [Sarcoptes scabiei]|uniref:[histone H3]-dimethyl-L-lysine(36) demethylase n=1 Tax=Sarcoptes scabiei TaxID=52283 RepID=A0A131ZUX5_SARSC|nr:lysine-specific demethylase 2B-like protein [Sarcoptes scabiei]
MGLRLQSLGMRIPPQSFTVDDVKSCVGSRRILDVMNVDTQKDDTMTMKEWCNYYNSVERHQLLNVISLEFSHTKLEAHVDSPKIVKQMDWIDLVWPRHLKRMQKEGTNALHEMKYPKVQKYCLMSVKGCYTDFHIDFGGTSVWYHILKGGKIFWLIPPTETNIQLYEKWTLSGKQSDIFFGDTVEHCCRVKLISGNTFFIPTGWIHAVYTLEDSLVFGGNFLHSFGIEKQLRVAQVEDITKVPYKFRYPFFTEVLWYVLVRYVHCLMGKNHLSVNDDGESLLKSSAKNNDVHRKSVQPSDEEDKDSNQTIINEEEEETDESKENLALQPIQSFHSFTPSLKIHLTPFEISGLKSIVNWLTQLPPSKRFVPDLLLSAENLLNDVKTLIDDHQHDDHNLAITNRPVLFWLNKKILAKINSQAKKLQARNQNLNKNSVASNYPKPTFLGSIKRNNSSSSNQYQVKLGTTLSNDLIANSLKGLIEQTGLKSGLDSTPSESPFNKLPRSMSSEPTKNSHETSETPELENEMDHDDRAKFETKIENTQQNDLIKSEVNNGFKSDLVKTFSSNTVKLKKPIFVIRLALKKFSKINLADNLAEKKDVIQPILRFLSRNDLLKCMRVSKLWNVGIVKRQPRTLDLSWTKISRKQMCWLLPRLPQLKSLKMIGCSSLAVSALHSCDCPLLTHLDVSWTESFCEELMRCLLSKPNESRPGLLEFKTRLKFLTELRLAGTLLPFFC